MGRPGQIPQLQMIAMQGRTLGRFDRVDELVRRTIELDPASALAYIHLGNCRLRQGRLEESRAAPQKSIAIVSYAGWGESSLVIVETLLGEVESAAERFEGLLERRRTTYVSSITLAAAALALKRAKLAAELMAAGFGERDTLVPLLPVVDLFAGLRDLPGAPQLLARIRCSRGR